LQLTQVFFFISIVITIVSIRLELWPDNQYWWNDARRGCG